MSVSPARAAALKIVSRVRERAAFAHETADSVLSAAPDLDPRDRALATRLAYGTIATAGTLDEALDRFLERPGRVEPRVRDALQIAAWEILFGDAEPYVAVSEGVELARTVRSQASGLANAVLRRLAEAAAAFPWGDPETDISALARLHGHPLWMTDLLLRDLGRANAEQVLAANNEPAPTYLALLAPPAHNDGILAGLDELGAEPDSCELSGCIRIGRPSALVSSAALRDSLVEVCDAGAQFAVHALRPRAHERIADVGAGRGTKTLLAQALARNRGDEAEIVAIDSHQYKLAVLAERAERAGLGHIETATVDATKLAEDDGDAAATSPRLESLALGSFDSVLLDAPCSGLGTLRRHPDKRWRLAPDEIENLAHLSATLLDASAFLVRPGGFMVYSTCTLTERENRDVVAGFLASDRGACFALDDLSPEVPASWRRFVAEEGWFQSLPERGGPDGHFVARLTRLE